jgi:hypothetical protein
MFSDYSPVIPEMKGLLILSPAIAIPGLSDNRRNGIISVSREAELIVPAGNHC